MNILISALSLDLSGPPTFTLTLYNELLKRGHTPVVYSPFGGELSTPMSAHATLDAISEAGARCASASENRR